MEKLDLDTIIKYVNDLPSLPHLVNEIIQLTDDPKVTARDINEVLSRDQGLAAKTLRMANSAYYGFSRHISTVKEATICLGLKTVRSIVMATSVNDMLNKKLEGYGLDKGKLWEHSQYSAIIAKQLSNKAKKAGFEPEVAYTAALLHDIGKIILNDTMKNAYPEVVDLVNNKCVTFTEAEADVMGFDHAMAGARVVERWNLPSELVEAIACHHAPELAGEHIQLATIIFIANAIALRLEKNSSLELTDLLQYKKYLDLVGLDIEETLKIVSEIGPFEV